MPYDKFIKQQIADDLVAKNDGDYYAATGLLTIGKRSVQRRNRLDEVDDQLDTIGFLGMSLGCVRCHDHEFDPISIEDYYSMVRIFFKY